MALWVRIKATNQGATANLWLDAILAALRARPTLSNYNCHFGSQPTSRVSVARARRRWMIMNPLGAAKRIKARRAGEGACRLMNEIKRE